MEIGQLVEWGTAEKLRKGIFKRFLPNGKADIKCISYCDRPIIMDVLVDPEMIRKTTN